jgi:hypothetical protein
MMPGVDRKADAERLAASIFAGLVPTAQQRGKSITALAGEALAAAREFYRTCDEG